MPPARTLRTSSSDWPTDVHRFTWRSPHPLDLDACMARFARWGPDPVNRYAGGAFSRIAAGPDGPSPYSARQDDDGSLTVTVPSSDGAAAARTDLEYRLAETLPRQPIAALAGRDPVIGPLWARSPGYRPPLGRDPYESLIVAITAQQVNLAWANTTRTRLVHRFGRRHEWDGQELWEFPTPEALATTTTTELREMQFTWRKAEYLIDVATAAADGYLDGLGDLDDDAVVARLTALRGIGRWSADWLLARCLGRPDAVAAGDLGVRKAVGQIYLGRAGPAEEAEVREVAAAWGAAANWAAHLLLEELA